MIIKVIKVSLLLSAISLTCLAATTMCKDGWSSITGTCGPESPAQKAIVARATAAVGSGSGQSSECPTSQSGCWLTDADPPPFPADGDLMRSALHAYFAWFRQNAKTRPTLMYLQNNIMAPLMIHYNTTDARKMAMQMTSFACPATDPAKWTNNQVLAFIAIRKQCMEWASTTATSASPGTVAQNYGAMPFPTPNRVRPGMGLYIRQVHAMIIIDILWKNNSPIAYQVAEANYDSTQPAWTSNDPPGQVPWLRSVDRRPASVKDSKGQPIPASSAVVPSSSYIVVNYEPKWQ